jgi:hypothetical protein
MIRLNCGKKRATRILHREAVNVIDAVETFIRIIYSEPTGSRKYQTAMTGKRLLLVARTAIEAFAIEKLEDKS